ncbi:MAG: glycoside hydrolase family 2 TIM barrel-domain containing protein [Alkalispirochaeta sp.]
MARSRAETPNPAHHRPSWRTLNGPWEFAVDDEEPIRPRPARHTGDATGTVPAFEQTIQVPFCPQSSRSGIGMTGHHPVMWYRKTVTLSSEEVQGRAFLSFGAVDFEATLWINGTYAGRHRGGYTPFRSEITRLVKSGDNTVLLRVEDRLDRSQPRGKQSWQAPFSCWYRECSGIWQPVWLEFVPRQGISRVIPRPSVTSLIGNGRGSGHLTVDVHPLDPTHGALTVTLSHRETELATAKAPVQFPLTQLHFDIDDLPLWSTESPELIDIVVRLTPSTDAGVPTDTDLSTGTGLPTGTDEIHTYTGFRRVEIVNGMLHLNGKPLYQRLILDQGYWPDGDYTAPDDAAIRRDIEIAQDMGFNGCRKHAKIEDPRFYYWADRLGYLIWEELPSPYEFSPDSRESLTSHTVEMIRRDGAHPSIIAWTLFNESWGVPDIHTNREQQHFVDELMQLVRDLDPQRLVIGNDGWEQVGGDVYGVHSYAPTADRLRSDLEVAFPHETGASGSGQGGHLENGRFFQSVPLPSGRLRMVTEFGGIGYRRPEDTRHDAWGYDNLAETPEELLSRLKDLVATVQNRSDLAGFTYTQLTDVEQEVNGLLYADRTPKADLSTIREIIIGKT